MWDPPGKGLPPGAPPVCRRLRSARPGRQRETGHPHVLLAAGGHGLPLQVGQDARWLPRGVAGMETDYVGYKLGLSKKRADWLVGWLREKVAAGKVSAKEMSQGLGRLGFAATALDWERPFLGPLHAWSAAIQGKPGLLTLPTMLRILMEWLAGKLGGGERLQAPESMSYDSNVLSFFTDAKAE